MVKIAKYIVFCVYGRFYLIWSPVVVDRTYGTHKKTIYYFAIFNGDIGPYLRCIVPRNIHRVGSVSSNPTVAR